MNQTSSRGNIQFNPKWITTNPTTENGEDYLKFIEEFGEHLCAKTPDKRVGFNAMTTSQIRNIFGEMRRIASGLTVPLSQEGKPDLAEKAAVEWQTVYTSFLMLRPKFAYNTARAQAKSRETRMLDFKKVFEKAHEEVITAFDFIRFLTLFEGILAYHKVHGGRD